EYVVAIVRPERHLPLGVVQRMQRPPPAEHMRQPVSPVVGAVQDDGIKDEGRYWLSEQEWEHPFEHRWHPAMIGQEPVQLDLCAIEQHEGEQRQDADTRDKRV